MRYLVPVATEITQPTPSNAPAVGDGERMGRHSKGQQRQRRDVVRVVDTQTGIAHLVRCDAAERGVLRGTYIATCAEVFQPAAMTVAETRNCPLCIPAQRSR